MRKPKVIDPDERVIIYDKGRVVKGQEALFVAFIIKQMEVNKDIHNKLMRVDKSYAEAMRNMKFNLLEETVNSVTTACVRLGQGSISVIPREVGFESTRPTHK